MQAHKVHSTKFKLFIVICTITDIFPVQWNSYFALHSNQDNSNKKAEQ